MASLLFLDCRARRSGCVGSTTLISSAFTALLNCAEVRRRNQILTNYRFLSHSLYFDDSVSSFKSSFFTRTVLSYSAPARRSKGKRRLSKTMARVRIRYNKSIKKSNKIIDRVKRELSVKSLFKSEIK